MLTSPLKNFFFFWWLHRFCHSRGRCQTSRHERLHLFETLALTMLSVSWRSLHWGSARHNSLTETINLLLGGGGDGGVKEITQEAVEMRRKNTGWRWNRGGGRGMKRRGRYGTENQIKEQRGRNVYVHTRTCLFTHVRSGCTDAGARARHGEEYEGRGKWHYSLPRLLMQFPSLPFSPSFWRLIHNETPREAGPVYVCHVSPIREELASAPMS